MVDTWFDRSTLFLSYGFTERRCAGHSSRHSMHGCANLNLSLAVITHAIARKESSKSVEFTVCAGVALACAWSVVPTVNPGVVLRSFLRRP